MGSLPRTGLTILIAYIFLVPIQAVLKVPRKLWGVAYYIQNYRALTGKNLVFWIGGSLITREVRER